MRLIDYDEFKWQLTHWYDNKGWAHQVNSMVFNLMELDEAMEKTPTVDLVKHGHWINKGFEPTRCSVCGITVDAINGIPWAIKSFEYCPHCGAKMEVEDETD